MINNNNNNNTQKYDMNTQNVKIYDNTGKLVVDLENGLFDADHLTYEDWSRIFMTEFKEIKFHDKNGKYIGGFIKGDN